MIYKLLNLLLKLDRADKTAECIKANLRQTVGEATLVIKRQNVMVKKTTTFYMAQAFGVIK